jgi:hypothetical protein
VTLRGCRFPGIAVTGMPRRRTAGFRWPDGRLGTFCDCPAGACGGRAGLLAMVMTAPAVRVTASSGPAWLKVLGDLDLRARCRFRSVTVRNLAIWLASALYPACPERIAARMRRRARVRDRSRSALGQVCAWPPTSF